MQSLPQHPRRSTWVQEHSRAHFPRKLQTSLSLAKVCHRTRRNDTNTWGKGQEVSIISLDNPINVNSPTLAFNNLTITGYCNSVGLFSLLSSSPNTLIFSNTLIRCRSFKLLAWLVSSGIVPLLLFGIFTAQQILPLLTAKSDPAPLKMISCTWATPTTLKGTSTWILCARNSTISLQESEHPRVTIHNIAGMLYGLLNELNNCTTSVMIDSSTLTNINCGASSPSLFSLAVTAGNVFFLVITNSYIINNEGLILSYQKKWQSV